MPLYEYECQDCHFRFEKLQRLSDPPPPKCPECGGKISQLMSAPAVQFKGSGWYVTDYGHKSSRPAGESKSGESRSGESKSGESKSGEKQAETKPATKADSKPETGKGGAGPKEKK